MGRKTRDMRVKDGFLRSVGLVLSLVAPLPWTIDATGIYFDASRPSDLEQLLEPGSFSAHTLERAPRLRAAIVSGGLTKYNVGSRTWKRPPTTRRVILVPGQVERDESIRLGAPDIKRNIDLLRAVRSSCPEAYLIYKPHPDVASGLRRTGINDGLASQWCDEIVEDADVGDMLCHVDEVHTMTSLTGFEALLRQRRVMTYGQPFYAGWGLAEEQTAESTPHPKARARPIGRWGATALPPLSEPGYRIRRDSERPAGAGGRHHFQPPPRRRRAHGDVCRDGERQGPGTDRGSRVAQRPGRGEAHARAGPGHHELDQPYAALLSTSSVVLP